MFLLSPCDPPIYLLQHTLPVKPAVDEPKVLWIAVFAPFTKELIS